MNSGFEKAAARAAARAFRLGGGGSNGVGNGGGAQFSGTRMGRPGSYALPGHGAASVASPSGDASVGVASTTTSSAVARLPGNQSSSLPDATSTMQQQQQQQLQQQQQQHQQQQPGAHAVRGTSQVIRPNGRSKMSQQRTGTTTGCTTNTTTTPRAATATAAAAAEPPPAAVLGGSSPESSSYSRHNSGGMRLSSSSSIISARSTGTSTSTSTSPAAAAATAAAQRPGAYSVSGTTRQLQSRSKTDPAQRDNNSSSRNNNNSNNHALVSGLTQRPGAHAVPGPAQADARRTSSRPSSGTTGATANPGAYSVSSASQTAGRIVEKRLGAGLEAESTSGPVASHDSQPTVEGPPDPRPGAYHVARTSSTAMRIAEKRLGVGETECTVDEDHSNDPCPEASDEPSDRAMLDDFVAVKTLSSMTPRATAPGVVMVGNQREPVEDVARVSDASSVLDDFVAIKTRAALLSRPVPGAGHSENSEIESDSSYVFQELFADDSVLPGAKSFSGTDNLFKSKSDLGKSDEYLYHDGDRMAVAVAVQDEEDGHLPKAIQFDPDAMPSVSGLGSPHKDRRFGLYACLVSTVVVIIVAGVMAAIILLTEKSVQPDIPYRETLGIRERVEYIIGSEMLVDEESPYYRALTWITHDDPIQPLPQDPTFMQRYIAAYFYYATSIQHPWTSCNPLDFEQDQDVDESTERKQDQDVDGSCTLYVADMGEPIFWHEYSSRRWLSSHPVCDWAGVFCDDTMEVSRFELNGSNMTGRFPEGAQYFPFLQSLLIGFGKLGGPLPAQIASMKHIHELKLRTNSFTGSVPLQIWSARTLLSIQLGSNSLTGSLPTEIGHLRDAKKIYIDDNLITGTIPMEIFRLKSLGGLGLNANRLSGTVAAEIGDLQVLQFLLLQHNNLSGTVPSEIGRLSVLRTLRVQHNGMLGGTIPTELYDLHELRRLDLFDCNFTGTLSPKVGNVQKLRDLRLSGNHLYGDIPTEIGQLALVKLWLNGNDFRGTMPEEVCELRRHTVDEEFQADCLRDDTSGEIELECKSSCCTLCCSSAVCLGDAGQED